MTQNFFIIYYLICQFLTIQTTAIIDNNVKKCQWPISDTLFVIDSTINVGTKANHARFLNFVALVSSQIIQQNANHRASLSNDGISTMAAVQFTPEARFEFGFGQHEEGLERLQKRIHVTFFFLY